MAKELIFSLAGADYASAPVKLERKKIYGWSDIVATDKAGDVCQVAYLMADRALIIPAGGYKQAAVDDKGLWVDKNEIVACGEDGEQLPIFASSFDAPIVLDTTASIEQFLDNNWEAVYQIVNPELAAAVGEKIYKFEFFYRAGTNHNDGYLINTPSGLFLFAGDSQPFAMVGLTDQTVIDEIEEIVEEDIDDLDFSMF